MKKHGGTPDPALLAIRFLGGGMLGALAGTLLLALLGREVPDALTMLCSAAMGGLAGVVTPTGLGKGPTDEE